MHNNRPINLNLFKFRFPIPAIVSILHRISGVLLFILIPAMLFSLSYSLTSEGFEHIKTLLQSPAVKFIVWLMLAPVCYHLVAGIRHLAMDYGLGVTLKGGRTSSWLVFIVSAVLIILVGMWIW